MQEEKIKKLLNIKKDIDSYFKNIKDISSSQQITSIHNKLIEIFNNEKELVGIDKVISLVNHLLQVKEDEYHVICQEIIDLLIVQISSNNFDITEFFNLKFLYNLLSSRFHICASMKMQEASVNKYKTAIFNLLDNKLSNLTVENTNRNKLYYTLKYGHTYYIPIEDYNESLIEKLKSHEDQNESGFSMTASRYLKRKQVTTATQEDLNNYLKSLKDKLNSEKQVIDNLNNNLYKTYNLCKEYIVDCCKFHNMPHLKDIVSALKVLESINEYEITPQQRLGFFSRFSEMINFMQKAIDSGICDNVEEALQYYNEKEQEYNFIIYCKELAQKDV